MPDRQIPTVTKQKVILKTKQTVVYCPDRVLNLGFLAIWREIFSRLLQSRELIWRLFLRDFRAKYRQSFLGILWAVLNPLITVGVFVFLNKSGVFNIGEIDIPYPAFALVGLTVWALFATGLTACSNSIISAGSMVSKINFPKSSLVIASMGQAIVEFLVRVGLTVAVFIFFKVIPAWTVIFLPLAVIPLFLLTLGLGFFLALLNGVFRDAVNIVTLLTTFLLFLLPILYPIPNTGLLPLVNRWNPLSHLIVSCRELVFVGRISDPTGFLLSSLFSLFVFLFCWRFFHIVEPKIAERV
jgi:homopolymeric O-antigen transport system permease protein